MKNNEIMILTVQVRGQKNNKSTHYTPPPSPSFHSIDKIIASLKAMKLDHKY